MKVRFAIPLLLVGFLLVGLVPAGTLAGDLWKMLLPVTEPAKAIHREKGRPGPCKDEAVEQLASQIDWIEHHLDEYGTIVAKHPDVWGESRLTRQREEYERLMAAELGKFQIHYQAAITRSDQAYLAFAMALQTAGRDATADWPADIQKMLSANTATTPIASAKPFEMTPSTHGGTTTLPGFGASGLQLEPTIVLDEMSRYINHLNELRRINEGDDTADSPGYSLNLVRIQISVIPGKKTREGCGAEITITAAPYITSELLPATFRNMVTNDLVDLLAPALTEWVNNEDVVDNARTALECQAQILRRRQNPHAAGCVPKTYSAPKTGAPTRAHEPSLAKPDSTIEIAEPSQETTTHKRAGAKDPGNVIQHTLAFRKSIARYAMFRSAGSSGIKTRCSYKPIPPSEIQEVFGDMVLARMIVATHESLVTCPPNRRLIHLMDVRGFLNEELNAAYTFLGKTSNTETDGAPLPPDSPCRQSGKLCCSSREYWTEFCTPHLCQLVVERRMRELLFRRNEFLRDINVDSSKSECTEIPAYDGIGDPEDNTKRIMCARSDGISDSAGEADNRGSLDPHDPAGYAVCHTMTAGLAWGILVESALLNEHLNRDLQEVIIAKGCAAGCPQNQCYQFFGPNPNEAARQAFIDYVRCRWPIRIFALDPVNDQQNVEDSFARRRETQIALAMGFASGKIGAQTLLRMSRRLEWDMQTIALNQTVVGFSHGDDTFGWRFYPRIQTPPIKGNVQTLWESVVGGPTTDADMCMRQLEPGMRECTAIVIMPSFVPYVTFDTRSEFFHLTNPKRTDASMRQTLSLSRSIKAMQTSAAQCAQCADLYRDGEVDRLLKRVAQLDRALPLQTMQVQVPYENTSGGFELFNRGITDLAPTLVGWYGAPGIDPDGGTVLFLVGKSFSVNGMQAIVGGRATPGFTLLSRQVMRVEIPAGLEIVSDGKGNEFADVHIATSYGVSDHLLVPIARKREILPGGNSRSDLAFSAGTLAFAYTFSKDKAPEPQAGQSGDLFLTIRGPNSAPVEKLPLTMYLYLNEQNKLSFVGSPVTPDFKPNPQGGGYIIIGPDLDTLVENLKKQITSFLGTQFAKKDVKNHYNFTVKGVAAGTASVAPLPINGQFEVVVAIAQE